MVNGGELPELQRHGELDRLLPALAGDAFHVFNLHMSTAMEFEMLELVDLDVISK